ncbi:ExbD/TolR family protein [Bacteroidota bacterium]
MAIKLRNKRSAEFSTSSMSDLVFLLLIFFMLTSTLISPNAIKLLLPQSSSRTRAKPAKVTVYINEEFQFFVDGVPALNTDLHPILSQKLIGQTDASVVLKVNFNVPTQYVVDVIEAVNQINEADPTNETQNKVILATDPR